MKEKAPGKTLLQVVGIILVVIGVLALLVSLINIAVLGMTGSGEVGEIMEQSLAATGATMADYKASVYIMTAGALLNLVIGIIGISFIRIFGLLFVDMSGLCDGDRDLRGAGQNQSLAASGLGGGVFGAGKGQTARGDCCREPFGGALFDRHRGIAVRGQQDVRRTGLAVGHGHFRCVDIEVRRLHLFLAARRQEQDRRQPQDEFSRFHGLEF